MAEWASDVGVVKMQRVGRTERWWVRRADSLPSSTLLAVREALTQTWNAVPPSWADNGVTVGPDGFIWAVSLGDLERLP